MEPQLCNFLASNRPYLCLSFSWLSWSINSGQSQARGERCVRVGCRLTDIDHSTMCMHKGGGAGYSALGPSIWELVSTDKPPSMIQLERCRCFSRSYLPLPPLPLFQSFSPHQTSRPPVALRHRKPKLEPQPSGPPRVHPVLPPA